MTAKMIHAPVCLSDPEFESVPLVDEPEAPIRSRIAPDINPYNAGIVDDSQAGNTCPGSYAPSPATGRGFSLRGLLMRRR